MRGLILCCWLATLCVACGPSLPATQCPDSKQGTEIDPAADVLATKAPVSVMDSITLPALPAWTDKYASSNQGDMRFFNISAVMDQYMVTRLEAVEIQNQFRDRSRAAGEDFDASATMVEVVLAVQAGQFESLDPKRLDSAGFIVVLDLDETLYDQYGVPAECADVTFVRANDKTKEILLLPGLSTLFDTIGEAGGVVVIFSANVDDTVYENLARITLGGAGILDHPVLAGVLTNSHLTMQSTSEGPGAKNPRKGTPVFTPSKDLRVLDPTLKRVIIVDDNPTRLFQHRNVRLFKKLRAEYACTDDGASAYAAAADTLRAEILDSVAAMESLGIPFATAFAPYSMTGRAAVALEVDAGRTVEDARDFLRKHPDLIDEDF